MHTEILEMYNRLKSDSTIELLVFYQFPPLTKQEESDYLNSLFKNNGASESRTVFLKS